MLGLGAVGSQALGQLPAGLVPATLSGTARVTVRARAMPFPGLQGTAKSSTRMRIASTLTAYSAGTAAGSSAGTSSTGFAFAAGIAAGSAAGTGTLPFLTGDPELIYAGFEDRGAKVPFEDRNMIVPPTEDLI